MKRHLSRLAPVLALLALLAPAAALALTFSPPSFDFTANPGDTISDSLKVQNESPDTLTITASAVNFTGKAGDETSGVPEFYPADEVRDGRGLAPWMTFVNKELTLKPGEHGSVFFQISVPKDADPGSHFGAILLTTKTPQGAQGVGVIANSASLILLKVNGDAKEELKLASFTASPALTDSLPIRFETRLENGGNVHERPYGEITIRDVFGRTAATIPVNRADNKSVLPGAARRFDADWTGRSLPAGASQLSREWNNFALGPYTAELTLRYGVQKNLLTAKTTVWIFPWLAMLVVAGGAGILIAGLKLFFAWYRKKIISQVERKG